MHEATRRRRPERTCVGCRRVRPKADLLRIVKSPTGVRLDEAQQLPGRGAYVCPNPACVERAAQRGGQTIRRALRGAPQDQVQRALDRIRATQDWPREREPAEHREEQNA